MQLLRKLRQKGCLGLLETLARRAEAASGRLARRMQALRMLQQAGHQAVFEREGGQAITLPRFRWWDGVFGLNDSLLDAANFLKSAGAEPLLRHLVFRLVSEGRIAPGKTLVDIGCWCGDGTLPWAKCLGPDGTVVAIDPSPRNLAFAQSLARNNGVANVRWVQAVCAAQSGIRLGHSGTLDHARFHEATATDRATLLSTTLDAVVGADALGSVALLHIDVEGFEARVLQGAAGIIAQSRPLILFEQHLCSDDTQAIVAPLTEAGYRVYMVNELLVDCRLDCRNFLAVPPGHDLPADLTRASPPPTIPCVPAVPGPCLLPYSPAQPAIRERA